ncbi:hypothetical protein U0070_015369 [Myodes glareolus]|uniref:Disks large homolog 5 N-terminal domain-containing protein n=1 Tax=Myodes glareolus TaxID=447135 RepID=A0AAW0GU91_MYOGA
MIQKQMLYSKKIAARKKREQEELSISVMDLSSSGEALPEAMPYHRMNSLEMWEKEHKQVMLDLQKWPMEISDALKKCKRLRKENKTYSCLHSQMAQELPELKNSIHVLRAEKRKLREEQIALQETCEEVKRLLKEVRETVCDPCAEQQQEQKSLDEGLKNLLKQKEMVTQQREKLQHQISVPEMRSENLQSESEQVTVQNESLLQSELPQQV